MSKLSITLIAFLLFINPSIAVTVELVENYESIENYRKEFHNNLKGQYRYLTPIFYQDSLPTMIVKKVGGKCKKAKLFGNTVKLYRSKCSPSLEYKLKNFPEFRAIENKFDENETSVKLTYNELPFSYPGVSYKFFMRDLYEAPEQIIKDFSGTFSELSYVDFSMGKIELKQIVSFNRKDYFFYEPRLKEVKQTIDVKKGDLLFSNNSGEFVIFKRFQPSVFRFKFLSLNKNLEEYLYTIPEKLFRRNNQKYCFMDNYINHSEYDCENLAIGGVSMQTYLPFNLIYINTNEQTLKLIK